MLLIPELLRHLAQYLDIVDLTRCVQVNQLWSQILTPSIWATFDDSIDPWESIAKSFWQPLFVEADAHKVSEQEDTAYLAQFARNCHHIRHLTIHHAWTLGLCLSAPLTGLVALHLMVEGGVDQFKLRNLSLSHNADLLRPSIAIINTRGTLGNTVSTLPEGPNVVANNPIAGQEEHNEGHDKEHSLQRAFASRSQFSKDTATFEVVSNQLFNTAHGFGYTEELAHVARVDLTQECWQLVFNCRGSLSQLVFGAVAKKCLCPPKMVSVFWNELLSRLTRLQHLDMMVDSHKELLRLLLTWEHGTLRSYSCESVDIQKLNTPLGYSDPGLQSIRVSMPVLIRELKVMFSFWPNLQDLFLHHDLCDDEPILPSQLASMTKVCEIPFVQQKLTALRLESPAALLRSNIHFPQLKSLTCRKVASPEVLRRKILPRFPLLESATFSELEIARLTLNPVVTEAEQITFPLKYLTIRWCVPQNSSLYGLVEQCPHLVEIKVPYGCPKLLSALGNCRSLQRVSLIATGECSKAAVNILVSCRWLTELICQEMRIHAEDILDGGPWSCVGLRNLRCEIVGIPRVDKIKGIEAFRPRIVKPITDETTKSEEPVERKLAEDEIELISIHSRAMQSKVYSQLARLTRLKELDLGFTATATRTQCSDLVHVHDRKCYFAEKPIPDTLKFTLESGLHQLASLRELRSIAIRGNHHMIGTAELDWMKEHWPMLRLISGADRLGDQGTSGYSVQALNEHAKKIQPKMEIRA